MANEPPRDFITLFRQAATSMTAGVLLVLIGTPRLAIIGFAFFIFSCILLVAAFIQIFSKYRRFYDVISRFTDGLTILFMFISLFSIFRNWTAITNAISSNNKTTEHSVLWVQSISSHAILVWLVVFLVAFVIVALFEILKGTWKNIKIYGWLRGILFTCLLSAYAAGCWGIARYGTVTFDLARFIPSLLGTIVSWMGVVWLKAKIKKASTGTMPEHLAAKI